MTYEALPDRRESPRATPGSGRTQRTVDRMTSPLWQSQQRSSAVSELDIEPEPPPEGLGQNPLGDDRETIQPGDRVLLVVENDETFAHILLDLAREKNFKALVALDGESAPAWRTSTTRTRSHWTSICPESTAGLCWTG